MILIHCLLSQFQVRAKDPFEPPPQKIEVNDGGLVGVEEVAEQVDGLTFREPFSGLSANEIESKLVMFLITDEDPLVWTKANLNNVDKNRLGGRPDVWCGREFRRAFQKMFEARPDLKDRCIVQRVVAGFPANLTGGVRRTLPPRAIVAICDGQYRLLNFCVGVPEPEDLMGLIEDAEENKTLLNLHSDAPDKLGTELANRNDGRLRRSYQKALGQLVEKYGWDESLYDIDEAWIAKHAELVSDLNPVFLFDAKLRFALSDASDLVRLLVLEQHFETRKNWCEALAPFIIGRPMQSVMGPIIDSVWGIPPVLETNKDDHKDLLDWFSTRRDNSILVFSVKPTLLDRNVMWPPLDISRKKVVKQDWKRLERAMSNHPFRTVTAEELAVLIEETGERPIRLLTPTRARYVFYEPKTVKPFVIRESDLPIKYTKRLEKAK
jgi:hypothetical protein